MLMERKTENLNGTRSRRERPATVSGAMTGMIPLVPLWLGTALVMCNVFPSIQVPWWGIALFGLILSAGLFALRGSPIQRWVMLGGLVLTAVFCLLFWQAVYGGLQTLVNDITVKRTALTGRIYLEYAGAGNVLTALIPLLIFLALLFTATAMRGSLIPLLPAAIALLAGTALGIASVGLGWALFTLGMMLTVGSGEIRMVKVTVGRAAVLLVCALVALAAGLVLQNTDLTDAKEGFARRLHEIRYDAKTNSMPEGQLADLGPWKKSDAQALSVTMTDPQKLYLRGHIYEVYTGSAWEPAENAELTESEALFYWLHENRFYGQSQIARAMELDADNEKLRVTVENLSACRENAYLPYAFADSHLLDPGQIGDIQADSAITSFDVYSGSIPKWYETQYRLTSANDPETRQYLALEQSYRQYVTDRDLQMTQESWNTLYRQLGETGGTHALYEIQIQIRDYLEEHLHYDESVYTLSGNGDFLHYVLESSDGGGYSVQYATAAALMLRYYGVPSRYVEGYYLTPEQAEQMQAGQPVTLTEENAHAWAEYYLNGIGFVPFEVTPGYIDPEDLNLETGAFGSAEDLFAYQSNSMTYAQTEQPDLEEPEVGQREKLGLSPLTLLLVIPLALLALLAFIVLRRLRLRRSLKAIDEADDRNAVAMRYGYAMALKARTGDVNLPEDAAAAHINELALFSQHEITQSQRKQMDIYVGSVLDACKRRWKWRQKLKLRWIEGIY